ncbi:MAG: RluA family pseudouridine synthase [Syntrophomonadaceae bacterium]|jgi:23S rRNA pseudouridine1911/1915/1917 synthase|nr:RluA family pseudouridine synthase [Syntrophomonadaceae bacterium]
MKFLRNKLPKQSRNNIKSLLSHGQVQVDDRVVTQYNYGLQKGQVVKVNWDLLREEKVESGLKIVYEDPQIIVIEKPPGLLSIASDKEKVNTAYHYLTDYVRQNHTAERIFIVHRLDRDTSGLMLFAKNERVKHQLQDAWKEMLIERAYLAVVQGQVKQESSMVKSWLKESKNMVMYSSSKMGDGKEAITHYRVLNSSSRYSLLEIRLETGRKNQIRVHMKDIGHIIVGDKKYGSTINPIARLGLHAHVLAFQDPISRSLLRFETEIPAQFSRLFKSNR